MTIAMRFTVRCTEGLSEPQGDQGCPKTTLQQTEDLDPLQTQTLYYLVELMNSKSQQDVTSGFSFTEALVIPFDMHRLHLSSLCILPSISIHAAAKTSTADLGRPRARERGLFRHLDEEGASVKESIVLVFSTFLKLRLSDLTNTLLCLLKSEQCCPLQYLGLNLIL